MSATFWIPRMGNLSPSFNLNNGNCLALLRDAGLVGFDSCGTFEAVVVPIVRIMVETALKKENTDYIHMRLVQLHEVLKVAEYLDAEVSWG